jgi:L-cysteine S-thiosulfotransferase
MKLRSTLFCLMLTACAGLSPPASNQQTAAGKLIAFDRNQGNCLACHKIADGELPGNIGPELTPELIHEKSPAELHDIIWDASRFNPNTSMPPYGRNKVLTAGDIDNIVEYLWSLQ